MTKAIEKIKDIDNACGWFGRLEDFEEECNDNGLEVYELNHEYAVVYCDEDETEAIVYFGGTERTITINSIK